MSDDPDCLGMCAIDDDVCTGCGRTLDQINAARGGETEETPPQPTAPAPVPNQAPADR